MSTIKTKQTKPKLPSKVLGYSSYTPLHIILSPIYDKQNANKEYNTTKTQQITK